MYRKGGKISGFEPGGAIQRGRDWNGPRAATGKANSAFVREGLLGRTVRGPHPGLT